MKWNPLVLFCDTCEADITPTVVSFRADGMLGMEGHCPNGHGKAQIIVAVEEVICHCHQNDVRSLEVARIIPFPTKKRRK